MSSIDDIIQSYVDERLKKDIKEKNDTLLDLDFLNEDDENSQDAPDIIDDRPNTCKNEILDSDALSNRNEINKTEIDFDELIKINKMQLQLIRNLEQSQLALRNEIKTLKRNDNKEEQTDYYDEDDVNKDEDVLKENSVFTFIPDIVKKRRSLVPTYCGRPIVNHKRYQIDTCKSQGCIRCNLENLVRSGYPVGKLQEIRHNIANLPSRRH